MTKNTVFAIAFVIFALGLGFFAGTKYQSSKSPNFANRQFGNGQMLQRNGNANNFQNGNRFRGGQLVGEIVGTDDKSITVKMPDGSSRIVLLSDKTTISKSTDGSESDLKTGSTVAVFGDTNTDGSVSATNIQLNPSFRQIGLTATPSQKQ